MRIVIDLQSCQNGSRHRGIGRYAMSLAKAMIRAGAGHEFLIFLTDRFPQTIESIRKELDGYVSQDAILVCSLFEGTTAADPNNAWRNRAAEVLRSAFIARLTPDMVFIPSLFEGFWDNTVVSVDPASYPTAVTLHDLIPLEEPERYIPARNDQDAYLRRLRDAKRADLVIAISSFVAEEARRRMAADPDRVVVALNGIDERFRPPAPGSVNRTELMKRTGIRRPFVFNTSPLEYRKNLEGLIASYASMSKAVREGHQLVIAGKMDDYARKYLNDLAAAEGLPADTIVLPGYVSDDDLIALYSECALFAFPSWSEGFGLPPLEAMACGAPVIVANTTSLPEVVGREDMQADPSNPPAMGLAMERVLTDPALREELIAFGIERSKEFTWERPAREILASFARVYQDRVQRKSVDIAIPARPHVAFVCSRMDAGSHVVGRFTGLISALARVCDVTLVSPGTPPSDRWAAAQVEWRELGWLDWHASRVDEIIYAGDKFSAAEFAHVIAAHPGIYLELDAIDRVDGIQSELSVSVQRDIVAHAGIGGILEAATQPQNAVHWHTVTGTSVRQSAKLMLKEGDDGLPYLPLFGDRLAADRYREVVGVPSGAPLLIAIVGKNETAGELTTAFRSVATSEVDAHFVVHVVDDSSEDKSEPSVLHMQGRIRRVKGGLGMHYRGIFSAADLLLIGGDISSTLAERCMVDASGLKIKVVSQGEGRHDVAGEMLGVLASVRDGGQRPAALIAPVDPQPVEVWVDKILASLATIARRRPSQLDFVEKNLPGSVRNKRADSRDLGLVSIALANNLVFEREPLTCIDITAYAAPGSIRRLDWATRQKLLALIARGERNVCAVFFEDGKFIVANQFLASLVGVRDFYLPDEVLVVRPSDRVIGLDYLHSFAPVSMTALKELQSRGAVIMYAATGNAARSGGNEEVLADLVHVWANEAVFNVARRVAVPSSTGARTSAGHALMSVMHSAIAANMPLEVLALDGTPDSETNSVSSGAFVRADVSAAVESTISRLSEEDKAGEGRAGTATPVHEYTVMGHLLGSYSLAIINRAVATTLERASPGHTHYLPYETDPIYHTEGVPPNEQPLMIELCERPRPNQDHEIVISQHWPIMPPKGQPSLALALFPWEESHVPAGIVQTLADGFDAVIAPAQCVTDALSVSGLRLPAATIGQPVDLAPFHRIARDRPARPIRRFLHISSCFPRKGIDVLLAAWARAFVCSDDVVLVIKTFPNPHNNVEQQLAALRQQYPDMAPVEVVNRDADRDEMPSFYADADAMVLPSRGEGYNLPALEAMTAGLPLIVTGHGGHRDFCGPDQARMIQFRFDRSASHVTGSHSMWVEPDVDDLVAALREHADPANLAVIERRRQNALTAANVEGDADAWVGRFNGMVGALLKPQDLRSPKLGWVSTWAIQCGIAQYSGYLLDRMSEDQQKNTTILCDFRTKTPVRLNEGELAYSPAWQFIGDKAREIVQAGQDRKVEALVIQHQDGLISWEQLGRIGNDPDLQAFVSVVVLHNARNLRRVGGEEAAMVIEGLSKMTRVLVHNIDDMNFLLNLGLRRNLGLFPHGAFTPRQTPWPRLIGPSDAPIIGCHGFFFRHKGIDKLIRAAAALRREWPGLRLRLVNARFPGAEHDRTIDECRAIAREVGMEDAIDWHLDFLPVEEIERLLAGCDLIALPYNESDDSASGAVRTVMATMVPLVATRVQIFAELGSAAAWANNNDPDELVRTITSLLKSPEKRREIQAGMHSWLAAHDWQRMATTLEDMIYGLVRQKRLGWGSPRNNVG
ncbi:glycosyltransferase [Paraburkholderia ferrariae]|uniref:glycosyltransferase n=1 Tax=Paraburkholderia ferrariae TaxID=386056 RepID=UPI000693B231|nr:glycosyltransferase [Paraburkholderia ferrariae]